LILLSAGLVSGQRWVAGWVRCVRGVFLTQARGAGGRVVRRLVVVVRSRRWTSAAL